mgnify:CR=1 FL=1
MDIENITSSVLTEEVGIPKLLSHISSLEALGRASNYNWDRFIDMVDLAFPKQNQQISFILMIYIIPNQKRNQMMILTKA